MLFNTGLAQDPAYKMIGKEELANEDVYSIVWEDEEDLLYVSTNNGVFVRRQNHFIKLQRKEGHIGDSYFNLQTRNGVVFCSNLNGQIFKVNDLELELFYEVVEDELWANFDYVLLEDELIVFSNLRVWRVNYSGESEVILDEEITKNPSFKLKNFSILGGTKIGEESVTLSIQGSKDYLLYNSEEKQLIMHSPLIADVDVHESYSHVAIGGNLYFKDNKGHFHSDQSSHVSIVDPFMKERSITLDNNELLCMNAKRGARVICVNNDTIQEVRSFFNDYFISAGTENKEGTLFFGTFGEGVIVVPNFNTTYIKSDELFLGLAVSPFNDLFVSTRTGKVLTLIDSLTLLDHRGANVDRVFYFEQSEDNHTVNKHLLYDLFLPEVPSIKDAVEIGDSLILVGFRNSLALVYSQNLPKTQFETFIVNELDTLYQELWQTKRVQAVGYYSKTDQILFSTSFGLEVVEWGEMESNELLFKGEDILCSDIVEWNEKLLLATKDQGILITDLQETKEFLTENDGLLSDAIRKIIVHDDYLFQLTEKGLQVYNLVLNKFIPLSFKEGVLDEVVNNFAVSNDKLWILYKHGVSSIDLKDLDRPVNEVSLVVDSVLLSGHRLTKSNEIFKANQNYLKIFFDYRHIVSAREVVISYQLNGWSEDWQEVSAEENLIEFKSLPSGEYSFRIKANYRNLEYMSDPIDFSIDYPYYQKWWFYLLISVSGSLIIAVFAIKRIKEIKKRDEVKIKMLENEGKALMAQLKAIRAQMNPHFIFNSITSIQDLILKDEKLKSYDYLEEFSKMVRTTLEMSDKEFVSIAKEVQYLDVYLKLEQLRFKDDFEFEIRVNASEEIKIPTLFLQPLVENALKHGLRHQIGAKKLLISFSVKNDTLIVEIEDNGIGIKASEELNKQQEKKYASFSTDAIYNRIRILNNQFGVSIEMQYTDLDKGTKVTVVFPVKYDLKS